MVVRTPTQPQIVYPETDDQPIAENTKQWECIVNTKNGLDAVFRYHPDVFVASDLFWYPVEGQPKIVIAPDVFVAFGRPKGHRPSYKQWEEGGIAPRVTFEIWSPGNRQKMVIEKFKFYEKYGVDEYYTYDPDTGELLGWLRVGGNLEPIEVMDGWRSPLLGITFHLNGIDLELRDPNGRPFATFLELQQALEAQEAATERARREAEEQRRRAEEEKRRAEEEKRRADEERQRAERARERTERLAAQLRAHGIEPTNGPQ